MKRKQKKQRGLTSTRSKGLKGSQGWHEFFDLADKLGVPDDFLAERGDGPPQERRLFRPAKVR
jgi:hypothetical protein